MKVSRLTDVLPAVTGEGSSKTSIRKSLEVSGGDFPQLGIVVRFGPVARSNRHGKCCGGRLAVAAAVNAAVVACGKCRGEDRGGHRGNGRGKCRSELSRDSPRGFR